MSKQVRLSKLIAARGLASRREAERWIEEGEVTVNGQVVVDNPAFVDPDEDAIRVRGRALPGEPEKVYFVLYKPRGYITSRNDPEGRKSVLTLLQDRVRHRVEPVGRLDFDTEGALLFTNDGKLANALLKPHNNVPKRYLARVYREPDAGDLAKIEQGRVFLEEGPARPAKVRIVDGPDSSSKNAWVEITVTEGRNRLIRRLFAALGHPVAKLRRESFATISIRGMERGSVRELTRDEVKRLKEIAQGIKPDRAGKFRYKKGFARPKPKQDRRRRGNSKRRA